MLTGHLPVFFVFFRTQVAQLKAMRSVCIHHRETTMPTDAYKYIDSFVSYLVAERHYSERTIEYYLPTLSGFWAWAEERFSCARWQDVTFEQVREWVVDLMDTGHSAATVNKKLSVLRSFYKFMLMRGHLALDPTSKVKGPKRTKSLPQFVREKEMDNLLDNMTFGDDYAGRRDHMILLLLYSTGIRLSELVGLDTDSVDFYTSTLKVLGKRNKERIIPFGDELKEAFETYLLLRAQQPQAKRSQALFLGKRIGRITKSSVWRIVHDNLSLVTTIKKRSPHVLRHSFATAMLNNGAEIEVVKNLLGHESIATTEIYTHTTFEELKKEYAKAHPRSDTE